MPVASGQAAGRRANGLQNSSQPLDSMSVEQELASVAPDRHTILSIGVFDGVHAGHRYLLGRLVQRAREEAALSGVVTFAPHPQAVLDPGSRPPMLCDLSARIKSLRELGLDIIAVLSFTPQLAQLGARDFVSLLKKHLKMQGLLIGPDFVLGKGGEGDTAFLRSLGQEMAFSLEIAAPFSVNGEMVSSTAIRRALAQGDMKKVRRLIGHFFAVRGRVVSSSRRGRLLGFPTANLDVEMEQALPVNGVYATITQIDDERLLSVTNIGTRPTFGDSQKTVETHLVDYHGDLYGRELEVSFVQRLRDEIGFASPQELTEQISRDIEDARAVAGELK